VILSTISDASVSKSSDASGRQSNTHDGILIIIEQMAKKHLKKTYNISTDSRFTSSPTLHETKEKSKIKSILKKLIHIRKGH